MSIETIWNHIHQTYLFPLFEPAIPWKTARYADIDVYYKEYIEVGGATFGQNFIPFLRDRGMPTQPRAFEWCCGAGFIAFSLYAQGLCDTLGMSDISPQAIRACRHTIAKNRLAARATAYLSDNLKDIPASERWDLVLCNPPHHADEYIGDRRGYDGEWRLRREFYATVSPFLKTGGVIVVCENNRASTVDDFRGMIEDGGLTIVATDNNMPGRTEQDRFYFMLIMRKGDTPPAWAKGV